MVVMAHALSSILFAESSPSLLSLDKAFDLVDQNLDVLIQEEVIAQTLQQAYLERSALLPTLAFSAGTQREQNVDFNGGNFSQIDGPFSSSDARLYSSFNFFNQNKYYLWKVQKQRYERSKLDGEQVRNNIFYALAILYFQCIHRLELVELAERSLTRDEQLLEMSQLMRDKGIAHDVDVIRSQVKVEENRERLIHARAQADALLLQIATLLALPEGREPESIALYEMNTTDFQAKRDALMKQAFESRVDLQLARMGVDISELARKAASVYHLPSVTLSGEYGWVGEDTHFDEDDEWVVRLSVDVPIFEGGKNRAKLQRIQHEKREQELRVERSAARIREDIMNGTRHLDAHYERIQAANKQVLYSKLELDLERLRFGDGLTDSQDVVFALGKLSSAELKLSIIELEYYLTLLELMNDTGNVRSVLTYLRSRL